MKNVLRRLALLCLMLSSGCGPKPADLEYLIKAAGPDRIVWGSDFGFSHWRMISERLDDALLANIDDAQRERVFYTNAARLLRWK